MVLRDDGEQKEMKEYTIHILVESELTKEQLKQEVFRIFEDSLENGGIETFSFYLE